MKRKIINYDVFKKIEESSITNAENELVEAQDFLAEALGLEFLELYAFGESDVTYETPNGNYIHATYTIDGDKIILENIETLVVDEESEKTNSRELVVKMVEAIIDNKDEEANQKFEQYVNSSYVRRHLNEVTFKVTSSKPTKSSKLRHKRRSRSAVAKGVRSRLKTLRAMSPGQKRSLGIQRKRAAKKLGSTTNKRARVYARKVKKQLKEWNVLSENVLGYVAYQEFGPTFNEMVLGRDEKGNISSVAIPTSQKRNEGKILSFNWKTLDSNVKILRGKMKDLKEDQNFAKAMAELKRYNNISDNEALEETLSAIVTRWPDVIYVTEAELADQIQSVLEAMEVKNFDNQTCEFMAEAILRTAHNTHFDRVNKIARLAGTEKDVTAECKDCEDAYASFKEVAESLFNKIDESEAVDLEVFSDLVAALHEVYELAVEEQDEETAQEVKDFIEQCTSVLNREVPVDLSLAEEVSLYLNDFVEANVEGASEDWEVSQPHHSVTGEHPVLTKKAKTDGTPSNHPGDWRSPAPVSDGKNYNGNLDDEMKNDGWANMSNDSTWPSLSNPYILKSGDFKMKEKSVVDDSDLLAQNQSNDTWPNLQNPYCPQAQDGNGNVASAGGDN